MYLELMKFYEIWKIYTRVCQYLVAFAGCISNEACVINTLTSNVLF